ncbi:quinone oxidoreductase family protein [Bradyrhizobium icense]|uniref:Quinone oxidoreductase n=1 Tax=Bradyrhizobium icense TaxID=1274631 RepID=A0A1B1UBN6_9BRAD|nr:quinone oxidoreductase [Bradyrhizobium icense]ANW00153.1 quinone oxidoreductase [Bradyrhizobium icense]
MTRAMKVHRTGGPDVLSWESIELEKPGPGQIRLKQAAIGLNFIDVYHRTGLYPVPLPFVPGQEGAGTVEAVGNNVKNIKVGDRVAYAGELGAYAETRIIDADRVVALPGSISFEQAAGMMLQGMTARMLLRETYPIQPGDTILVHAAAGGTGLILCQWAAQLGATVIGTVSSIAKAKLARAHGCHHPIIHGEQDFVAEVSRITAGKRLPVVYDSIGRDTFLRSLDCLRYRGMMVSFGQSSGPVEPLAPMQLALRGSLYLTRPLLRHHIEKRHDLVASANDLFDMVGSKRIHIEINQTYALSDAAKAHSALEDRTTTGSTILTV